MPKDDAERSLGDRGMSQNDECLVAAGATAAQFDMLCAANHNKPKTREDADQSAGDRNFSPPANSGCKTPMYTFGRHLGEW